MTIPVVLFYAVFIMNIIHAYFLVRIFLCFLTICKSYKLIKRIGGDTKSTELAKNTVWGSFVEVLGMQVFMGMYLHILYEWSL